MRAALLLTLLSIGGCASLPPVFSREDTPLGDSMPDKTYGAPAVASAVAPAPPADPAPAPADPASAPDTANADNTSGVIAIVAGDAPSVFLFVSTTGKFAAVSAAECAADADCMSLLKQMADAGKLEELDIVTNAKDI